MCGCNEDMPENVRYYLTKVDGLLGRCPEIPEKCAKRLIGILEAKSVKSKPKQKEPKLDGSKGSQLASE